VRLLELSAHNLEDSEYAAFGTSVESVYPWRALLLVGAVVIEVLLHLVGHELLGSVRKERADTCNASPGGARERIETVYKTPYFGAGFLPVPHGDRDAEA
jgi:hypothetical protein